MTADIFERYPKNVKFLYYIKRHRIRSDRTPAHGTLAHKVRKGCRTGTPSDGRGYCVTDTYFSNIIFRVLVKLPAWMV